MQSPPKKTKWLYGGITAAVLLTVGLIVAGGASAYFGHDHSAQQGALACRPGELNMTGDQVAGSCASFTFDAAAGSISGYTFDANGTQIRLIESLTVDGLAGSDASTHRGSFVLAKDDVRLMAHDAPVIEVMARNATTTTLVLPAAATIVVHQAVDDWSPAGATITNGAVKLNLLLPPGATISQDGQTLTIQSPHGLRIMPAGMPPMGGPMGHGFGAHGPGGPGPRDGHGPGPGGRDGPDGPDGPRGGDWNGPEGQ